MGTIFDFFRFVFISFEMLAIGIFVCVYLYIPELFGLLGNLFLGNEETASWILSCGSLGLTSLAFKSTKEILLPYANNSILLKWPDFQLMKNRAFFGAFESSLCTVVAFSLLFVKAEFSSIQFGFIGSLVIVVNLITFASLWVASITVRECLESVQN